MLWGLNGTEMEQKWNRNGVYVILIIGLYPIIRINDGASDSTASGRAGLSTQYALGFLVFT